MSIQAKLNRSPGMSRDVAKNISETELNRLLNICYYKNSYTTTDFFSSKSVKSDPLRSARELPRLLHLAQNCKSLLRITALLLRDQNSVQFLTHQQIRKCVMSTFLLYSSVLFNYSSGRLKYVFLESLKIQHNFLLDFSGIFHQGQKSRSLY